MVRSNNKLGYLAIAVALLALAGTPLLAGGERLVVQVDEPFEINGEMYEAGVLSVKVLRDYTPSSTLNEVWVGNERVGMMLAKRGSATLGTRADTVVFERTAGGHLTLVGYTLRGQEASKLYRYEQREGRQQWAAPLDRERAVLLAAN